MKHYYHLWAAGPDQTGIVASVTKALFDHQCNVEDSSMMRLGSEFGMFLIFSAPKKLNASFEKTLQQVGKRHQLQLVCKPISRQLAHGKTPVSNQYLVTLHGADRPGLVHLATSVLAQHKFNISDLQTHRTETAGKAGYILFIEGHLSSGQKVKKIETALKALSKSLGVQIVIKPVLNYSL